MGRLEIQWQAEHADRPVSIKLGAVTNLRVLGPQVRLNEAEISTEQASFAGESFRLAYALSVPSTRSVLDRVAFQFEKLWGRGFDENKLEVTVRVEERSAYRQLQFAHLDWVRGTRVRSNSWSAQSDVQIDRSELVSLGWCHSIDCVIGGAPTIYYLADQIGHLQFGGPEGGDWVVEDVMFGPTGPPNTFPTGSLVYRPPLVVHEAPPRGDWCDASGARLFVSCDYWTCADPAANVLA